MSTDKRTFRLSVWMEEEATFGRALPRAGGICKVRCKSFICAWTRLVLSYSFLLPYHLQILDMADSTMDRPVFLRHPVKALSDRSYRNLHFTKHRSAVSAKRPLHCFFFCRFASAIAGEDGRDLSCTPSLLKSVCAACIVSAQCDPVFSKRKDSRCFFNKLGKGGGAQVFQSFHLRLPVWVSKLHLQSRFVGPAKFHHQTLFVAWLYLQLITAQPMSWRRFISHYQWWINSCLTSCGNLIQLC